MSWQIYIFLSVFLFSTSTLLQRALVSRKDADPITFSIYLQFFASLTLGAIGLLTGKISFSNLNQGLFVYLALGSVLYSLSNIFIFKSLKTTQASKFTIIFASRVFFTVLGATVFLQEGLNLTQILGASLIFLGIVISNWQTKNLKFSQGDILALLAALAFGLANVNDRFLVINLELYAYLFLIFLFPALGIGVFYPQKALRLKIFKKPEFLYKFLGLSVIYSLSALTFFKALQVGTNASQVASINLVSVVLTVLLAIVLLKETQNWQKKLLGAVVSFLGLLLI